MIVMYRALGVLWNLGFPFVAINGVPLAGSREHDTFEWFAEIWIPAVIGTGTLVATAVAVWVSHRATLLSRAVEDQRQLSETARAERDSRERLQSMAIEEARALTRWVNAVKSRHWTHSDIEKVGAARHAPTLADEARALLQQSLVPGAQELLELTELEIQNLFELLPDAIYMPDRHIQNGPLGYATSPALRLVPEIRRRRLLSNIRRWGLDPESAQPHVAEKLNQAQGNPDAYWDYRNGLGISPLEPLRDLPEPPWDATRAKWLEGRGVSVT
jgi:hypothetical protein